MTLDKIAVVTITPPLDICQTELSTVFNARYENKVANKSNTAGQKAFTNGPTGLDNVFECSNNRLYVDKLSFDFLRF